MTTDLPLITTANILALGTDALPAVPPTSCHAWMHLLDEDNPAESVTVWGIGERGKTDTMHTSAMQTALLLEAVRFPGITIVTNRNTPRRSTTTTLYAKLIFTDAPEDNMTVHRLLGGAEAGEQVSRAEIIPTDLRGAANRKSGGPSKKGAWETVYGHCKRYAEKAAEEAAAQAPADPLAAPPDVAAPPANAERTASGLASRVLRRGTGTEHPGPTDRVTVHYTGWTTDGEMFDSSRQRGEPTTFPLNRVIAGWTEGVQLMVVGEQRRFWIPERLAYQGRPGAPAGMLVFDVELLSIQH